MRLSVSLSYLAYLLTSLCSQDTSDYALSFFLSFFLCSFLPVVLLSVVSVEQKENLLG
jgi:hypothetical protein